MKKRLHRFRPPSPAMTVACVALLVALAGTSVAAVSVLPRGSVGPLQLRANSVNSSKVLNGSLLRADFRAGQIPAGPAGPPGAPGATGATGAAGAAGVASPGYVAEVKSVTSTSPTTTTSTSFTTLGSATTTVTVPSGETGRVIAFFSAVDACYGAPTTNERCLVRITVDGTAMDPVGTVWDNNGHASTAGPDPVKNQNDSLASRAIVRTSGTLNAGTHTIVAQIATTSSLLSFLIDDWALVVQRVKLS